MKISTKGRYGLRFMIALAARYRKGVVPLREIASQEQLSEKYMEQIVALYTKGGLVSSVRGSRGGYALNRPPEAISVGDILRLSEPALSPPGIGRVPETSAERDGSPALTALWVSIQDAVESVVNRTSLADLMQK